LPNFHPSGRLVHLEFDTTIAELGLIGIVGAHNPGFAIALRDQRIEFKHLQSGKLHGLTFLGLRGLMR